jgi:hypothetical protein
MMKAEDIGRKMQQPARASLGQSGIGQPKILAAGGPIFLQTATAAGAGENHIIGSPFFAVAA